MARQMKDSGIEWIDSIPTHWQTIKLCYVTETIFLGKTPVYFEGENENYTLGQRNNQQYGLDFIGIKYSTDEHFASCNEQEFLQYGDVLLNSLGTGSVGRIGYFDITNKRVLTDGHIIVIRANEHMNARYLFFYLRTLRTKFEDDAVGSTNQAFLTVPKIYKTSVPFPPLLEQQRIAAFLDRKCAEIDAVIERTKATIEEYKKLKQAVITEAVTKGVRGPRPMKDSGIEWIGEIPEGWAVRKLGRFISIRSGITLGKTYPQDAELVEMPYLRVANVKADGFALDDVATIEVTPEEAEKYALKAGELLMTEGGDRDKLGRGTIWHGEIAPCLHQNHVFAATCDETWLLTQYLAYLTASNVGRQYFDITAKKTTNLACTNSNTILQFKIPLPSTEEQQEIIEWLPIRCSALDTLIAKKTALLTELETYKKSLIYEYVTGKKEVTA